VQKFESLSRQLIEKQGYAGSVAFRPIEAGDKTDLNRIAAAKEDDRNRRGCRLRGLSCSVRDSI
jgi:hypothetical protein